MTLTYRTHTILLLFLICTACSENTIDQDPRVEAQQPTIASSPPELVGTSIGTSTWQIEPSYNGIVAIVQSTGNGPEGPIKATLRIQCPTPVNEVTDFEFVVHETDHLGDFDFDSFEGPYAPNLGRKLVEFNARSDKVNHKWLAMAHGSFVTHDSFRFGPSGRNKPDRTKEIAQLITGGNVSLTAIAHDARDWKRTLEITFPAMDPKSEIASKLHGCKIR